MVNKKSKIEFKLDEEMFLKYKKHCDKNGQDMSKRLRLFIESEIPKEYRLISVESVTYEPVSEVEVVKIMDFNFPVIKSGPKCFIINTSDIIEGDIQFYIGSKSYKCDNVEVLKMVDGEILMGCSSFTIEYI